MRRAAALLLALASVSLLAAPQAGAHSEYEPNDSLLSAAGPLLLGSTYTATYERPGERDIYFFHMSSKTPAPAELTLTNLGGSGTSSDLRITILDSTAAPIAGATYIRAGEARVVRTAPLEPQKYYAEVAGGERFGDSYTLTIAGGPGAFGSYATISGRCASARKASSAAQVRLERAEGKSQRSLARTRRARFGSPEARRSARRAYRKARARLKERRGALAEAEDRREPWCSIGA